MGGFFVSRRYAVTEVLYSHVDSYVEFLCERGWERVHRAVTNRTHFQGVSADLLVDDRTLDVRVVGVSQLCPE